MNVNAQPQRTSPGFVDERRVEPASEGVFARCAIAVKDMIDVVGLSTGAGTAARSDAARDALVVDRLRHAGAVIVGKTTMDAWGLGVTGRNADFGRCPNPWNASRLSGGSSSGSAYAVATGAAAIALGTDTAGSLRIPAAWCGVTALKPTHGVLPLGGILPIAPTLDCVGPMARTAADCARAFEVMAGNARPRSTSLGIRGLRVGLPRGRMWSTVADEVGAATEAAGRDLERLGATLHDVEVPSMELAAALNATVLLYELANDSYRQWPVERSELAARAQKQLELGAAIERREYDAALNVRSRWRAQLGDTFANVDVLLHPTTTDTAPGEHERVTTTDLTRLCTAWSFGGLPVLQVPVGFDSDGMPIGASLVGPAAADMRLLAVGTGYQTITDWHARVVDPAPLTA